jgi:hypothetical protein
MRAHLALLLAVIGCGDDSSGIPDAHGHGDGGSNSVPCTYTEMDDVGNAMSATPEVTGITFASAIGLCGSVNSGHFNSTQELVDQDIYRLTFSADADLILHFTGAAQGLDELAVQVAQSSTRAGYGSWTYDHGALVAHVTPGDWYVTVGAFNQADVTTFPYKIVVAPDSPDRCPHVTTGGFTEAGDGASNNGNDMMEYALATNSIRRLTPSTTDSPEASGVTAAPGGNYRLTGTLATVTPIGDDYMDRDTYEFSTDAATNEVSVRLNWTGNTRDFDFIVIPQNAVNPIIGAGFDNVSMEEEFETFAVAPSSKYWLWVAAENGSTLPSTYDATLCSSAYVP